VTVSSLDTPVALFLYHHTSAVDLRYASHLSLARELGFRPILARWRDVRVTEAGTYLARAEEVTPDLRKRPLISTCIKPDVVVHRTIVNGGLGQTLDRIAQRHTDVKLSYTPAWARISRKVTSELAFKNGQARGFLVARPKTFILKGEIPAELRKFGRAHPVIFKPSRGSQCFGIQISTPATFDRILDNISNRREFFVAQELVPNTVLYKGHRTDLRLYALVNSFSPLKFRVYRGGVTRIAARAADDARQDDNLAVLTGCSYRKRHHLSTHNATVEDLLSRLSASGIVVDDFWDRIDVLMHNVFSCLAASTSFFHLGSALRFYLTGFDVILRLEGRHLEPLFLESNYVPQLNGWGSEVDRALRTVHREWIGDLRNRLRNIP